MDALPQGGERQRPSSQQTHCDALIIRREGHERFANDTARCEAAVAEPQGGYAARCRNGLDHPEVAEREIPADCADLRTPFAAKCEPDHGCEGRVGALDDGKPVGTMWFEFGQPPSPRCVSPYIDAQVVAARTASAPV